MYTIWLSKFLRTFSTNRTDQTAPRRTDTDPLCLVRSCLTWSVEIRTVGSVGKIVNLKYGNLLWPISFPEEIPTSKFLSFCADFHIWYLVVTFCRVQSVWFIILLQRTIISGKICSLWFSAPSNEWVKVQWLVICPILHAGSNGHDKEIYEETYTTYTRV